MPYTYITWAQLKTQLAARLSVTLSASSYWTDTELGLILAEAMRTYGVITGYWKERGTFATAANTAFYDICSLLDNGALTLSKILSFTITDRDLIKELQFALMEKATSQSVWPGTEMFTLDDLTQAIQRRRDQLLVETGTVLTNSQVNVPSVPISRVPLVDTTIDVRWASWLDVGGVYSRLQRTDEFALNAFRRGWSLNQATPESYSVAVTPPVSLQLAPTPQNVGSMDMLTVQSGAALTPSSAATLLGIPDDLVWVLKWGALADLLGRAGISQDLGRAKYCEMRWRQGVEIARMQSPVVQAEINGVPLQVGSLPDIEKFRVPYWRNTSGTPASIGVAGYNMVALADVPDGIYSVTMDVARKAPIPVLDADYVQIGREELDAVLDYSEHVASFKQGNSNTLETMPLMNNFYRMSSIHNQRMRANAAFYDALGDRAIRPKEQHSRRSPRETQDTQGVAP